MQEQFGGRYISYDNLSSAEHRALRTWWNEEGCEVIRRCQRRDLVPLAAWAGCSMRTMDRVRLLWYPTPKLALAILAGWELKFRDVPEELCDRVAALRFEIAECRSPSTKQSA